MRNLTMMKQLAIYFICIGMIKMIIALIMKYRDDHHA